MKGEVKMSTRNLIRWSGLISILAGVLYALGALLHPVGEDLASVIHPNWIPSHFVYWISAVLMQLGLVGLYARQVDKAGRLGLVGFVLAFIGTALVGAILFLATAAIPLIAAGAPAIFDQAMAAPAFIVVMLVVGFGFGYVLFGIATMRAGVLPRWAGLLLIIGVLLFMLSEAAPLERTLSHVVVTVGDVVFGFGLVWMGYALWSEKREAEVQGALRASRV
jgi:hypothetical protein